MGRRSLHRAGATSEEAECIAQRYIAVDEMLHRQNAEVIGCWRSRILEVLQTVFENYDCNYGINWETIRATALDMKRLDELEN